MYVYTKLRQLPRANCYKLNFLIENDHKTPQSAPSANPALDNIIFFVSVTFRAVIIIHPDYMIQQV